MAEEYLIGFEPRKKQSETPKISSTDYSPYIGQRVDVTLKSDGRTVEAILNSVDGSHIIITPSGQIGTNKNVALSLDDVRWLVPKGIIYEA